MQLAVAFQSFDGGDFVAIVRHGERETRDAAATVNQNRARATLPVIAALLRTRQAKLFPQKVEEHDTRFHHQRMQGTVDRQGNRKGIGLARGTLRIDRRFSATETR